MLSCFHHKRDCLISVMVCFAASGLSAFLNTYNLPSTSNVSFPYEYALPYLSFEIFTSILSTERILKSELSRLLWKNSVFARSRKTSGSLVKRTCETINRGKKQEEKYAYSRKNVSYVKCRFFNGKRSGKYNWYNKQQSKKYFSPDIFPYALFAFSANNRSFHTVATL